MTAPADDAGAEDRELLQGHRRAAQFALDNILNDVVAELEKEPDLDRVWSAFSRDYFVLIRHGGTDRALDISEVLAEALIRLAEQKRTAT